MSDLSKNKRDVDTEFVKEEREKGSELYCTSVGLIERQLLNCVGV